MMVPRLGLRRVVEEEPIAEPDEPRFAVQEWRSCRCPNCFEDAHWFPVVFCETRPLANSLVISHNRALGKVGG